MKAPTKARVGALVATFRRTQEMERLLHSLRDTEPGLVTVFVVDNEGSERTRSIVQAALPNAHCIQPGRNLGCGGGLRLAAQRALESEAREFTHLFILDDDAVVPADVIPKLIDAMEGGQADVAYPLVTNGLGEVAWLPGLAEQTPGLDDRFHGTPEEFRIRFGSEPRDFVWAQGICLLVTREAFERCGPHREDFWVRGEDLEFSLRLTAEGRGILVPTAVVQHLPPPEASAVSRESEYLKHCALIQNIAYVGLRLPHGRRIAWTLAGALRRFFRCWPYMAAADACRAIWRGAVLGEPAGLGKGNTFLARFAALSTSR